MTDPLIDSLRRAVDQAAGEVDDAIGHCATVLTQDRASEQARRLMARAMAITEPAAPPEGAESDEFNWAAAEREVGDIAAPMFVSGDNEPEPNTSTWEVENAGITLADVGGMREVQDRLGAAFLAPMRNPELRQLYGKSLRGGLLL